MTASLNEIVNFLLGAGTLDGYYFGDIPEGEKGSLWWRRHLREAYTASQDTEYQELKRIRKGVAAYYRVSADALVGKTRTKGIVIARQMAILMCRGLTPCSTTEIAVAFNRDHTTVVWALEKMRQRVNNDPELRKQYEELKTKLEHKDD